MTSAPTVISGNTFTDDSSELGGAIQINARRPDAHRRQHVHRQLDLELRRRRALHVRLQPNVLEPRRCSKATRSAAPTPGRRQQPRGNRGGGAVVSVSTEQPVTIAGNTFRNNRITGTETATNAREGARPAARRELRHLAFPVTQREQRVQRKRHRRDRRDRQDRASRPAAPASGSGVCPCRASGDAFIGNRIAVNDGAPPRAAPSARSHGRSRAPRPRSLRRFTASDDLFAGQLDRRRRLGRGDLRGRSGVRLRGYLPREQPHAERLDDHRQQRRSGRRQRGRSDLGLAERLAHAPELDRGGQHAAAGGLRIRLDGARVRVLGCMRRGRRPVGAGGRRATSARTRCCRRTARRPRQPHDRRGLERARSRRARRRPRRRPADRSPRASRAPALLGAVVDMGAFEYQHLGPLPSCPPTPPGTTASSAAPQIERLTQSHRVWREGSALASSRGPQARAGGHHLLVRARASPPR